MEESARRDVYKIKSMLCSIIEKGIWIRSTLLDIFMYPFQHETLHSISIKMTATKSVWLTPDATHCGRANDYIEA